MHTVTKWQIWGVTAPAMRITHTSQAHYLVQATLPSNAPDWDEDIWQTKLHLVCSLGGKVIASLGGKALQLCGLSRAKQLSCNLVCMWRGSQWELDLDWIIPGHYQDRFIGAPLCPNQLFYHSSFSPLNMCKPVQSMQASLLLFFSTSKTNRSRQS